MGHFRLGVVGAGKIVRDQHVAAIAATPGLELVASADPHARLEGIPGYADLGAMLEADSGIDAVAICTPAHLRHRLARQALAAGKAVLLEKPPGATLAETRQLKAEAEARGQVLFAAWHSRYAPGIARAWEWLAEQHIERVDIRWHEDVRVWHPGQPWLWEAGGMGVFDPGINALSILTCLVSDPLLLVQGELEIPANAQTPIAARLHWRTLTETAVSADFDFRHEDPPCWEMTFATSAGRLVLSRGGARLSLNGETLVDAPEREYLGVYRHFHELLTTGDSDMDLAPLEQVADALMLSHRRVTEPFVE